MARRKYYRNLKEVEGIDPEALWYRSAVSGMMVLVDQDQFITAPPDDSNFYRVKFSQTNRKSFDVT